MTGVVHKYLVLSVTCAPVGTAHPRNRCRIVMLRFPEKDVLSTLGHPRPKLTRSLIAR
jgi:hypothetical protein